MVVLLFPGQALEKMLRTPLLVANIRWENLDEIFAKLVQRIKVSPFNSESNSASNGLVFIVRRYLQKRTRPNFVCFRCLLPTSFQSIQKLQSISKRFFISNQITMNPHSNRLILHILRFCSFLSVCLTFLSLSLVFPLSISQLLSSCIPFFTMWTSSCRIRLRI